MFVKTVNYLGRLLAAIALFAAALIRGVAISPSSPEVTYKSGGSFTLKCIGDGPVNWTLPVNQDRQFQVSEKNSSVVMTQYMVDSLHATSLSVNRSSHLDTGYYECGPLTEGRLNPKKYRKIYVFVADDIHLLAIPGHLHTLTYESRNVIIPCRPTSRDVHLTLIKDAEVLTTDATNVGMNVSYDVKNGFELTSLTTKIDGVYKCLAELNGQKQSATFLVTKSAMSVVNNAPYIWSDAYYSEHIVSGQNLTLYCTAQVDDTESELEWTVPDLENQKRLFRDDVVYLPNNNLMTSNLTAVGLLYIQNVTSEDDGEYVCKLKTASGNENTSTTYTLRSFPPNATTYLRVTIDGGADKIVRAAESAEWTVNVTAYPKPIISWRVPDGIEVETSSTKIVVENDKSTSKLIINNVQVCDSGTYELDASNELHEHRLYVTLMVEDKPSVQINNKSALRELHEVQGETYSVECHVVGYPLPDVEWAFKKCQNDTECQASDYTRIPKNAHSQTVLNTTHFISVVNISSTEIGQIECSASNDIGNSSDTSTFHVTNKTASFYIDGPTAYVQGDDIQIMCSASTHKFRDDIQWIHRSLDHENFSINVQERITITNNETEFSHRSYLTIENAKKDDTGTYVCTATESTDNTTQQVDYPIVVTVALAREWNGSTANITWIYVLAIILLLGFLTMCICMWLNKKKKLKKTLALAGLLHFKGGNVESWNPFYGIVEQADLLPYDPRWEFPVNKLKLGEQIGSGEFGVVYKAEAIGIMEENVTTTVAVKTVKPDIDPMYAKALVSELKVMLHLGKHVNVVNLLGACTRNITKKLMVIIEYCPFGNIQKFMLNNRKCFVNQVTSDGVLDWNIRTNPQQDGWSSENVTQETELSAQISDPGEKDPLWRTNYYHQSGDGNYAIVKPLCTHDLICWSFQVACGMEYLARRKILHGDLATRNILLAEDNVVKISDFGFAKAMCGSDNYRKLSDKQEIFPVKWMAIESLRDRVFSTQSDVWAFGVVLWEIFSLAVTPYPNIQTYNELYNQLVKGYRMEQPEYANHKLHNTMLDCWKADPAARPSFTELADRLGSLLEVNTKLHYIKINENYIKRGVKYSSSSSTDYFSLLTQKDMSINGSNAYPTTSERMEIDDRPPPTPDRPRSTPDRRPSCSVEVTNGTNNLANQQHSITVSDYHVVMDAINVEEKENRQRLQ